MLIMYAIMPVLEHKKKTISQSVSGLWLNILIFNKKHFQTESLALLFGQRLIKPIFETFYVDIKLFYQTFYEGVI